MSQHNFDIRTDTVQSFGSKNNNIHSFSPPVVLQRFFSLIINGYATAATRQVQLSSNLTIRINSITKKVKSLANLAITSTISVNNSLISLVFRRPVRIVMSNFMAITPRLKQRVAGIGLYGNTKIEIGPRIIQRITSTNNIVINTQIQITPTRLQYYLLSDWSGSNLSSLDGMNLSDLDYKVL
jgi:hypothetical protein